MVSIGSISSPSTALIAGVAVFVVNWIEWARGVEPAPSAYLSDEEAAKVIAAEQQPM